jgi:GDP-mannose 6-dehydrogenase
METPLARAERIAVLGLGYVGCVTAACLAELGHSVTGVDRDEFKVRSVLDGEAPFYEPGLAELVRKGRESGRLTASTCLAGVLPACDIALVCVGTPSERNGNLDLQQLARVAEEIGAALANAPKPLIVAVRSTVFPGTCDEVVVRRLAHASGATVVSNPEFLREGSAVDDFMSPSLIVVGGTDRTSVQRVADLYAALPTAPCLVSLRTAEMFKYACNAFHALKIGFANEVGTLAETLGVSGSDVMEILCRDTALNISPAYLKPGFAFGGSCLPKDLRALVHRAGRLDLRLPLLESILPANEQQIARGIRAVLDLPVRRLGFFGLAFKQNTDDLRESPVVMVLETLLGKGRDLRVFDPHIQLSQIYGSNRRFLLSAIPHIGKLLDASLEAMLEWAECVIITQKPGPEAAAKIRAAGIPVLDLAGGHLTTSSLAEAEPVTRDRG